MIEDLENITWDYRVFKQDLPVGKDGYTVFFIVEASYDANGNLTGVTPLTDPCVPFGVDMESLQEEFKTMALAFNQPTLSIKDLPENSIFIQRADGIGDFEEENVD